MAKTATYSLIASYTIPSAASTYTFSSIPSTYTDLVLISNPKVSSVQEAVQIQFNSDTGNNYSFTQLYGNGTSAFSARAASIGYIYATNGTSTTNYGAGVFNILDYSNTTTYKTTLGRFSEAAYNAWSGVGLWRSTAAITSITLTVSGTSNTLSAGSTFKLYGIQAGNA